MYLAIRMKVSKRHIRSNRHLDQNLLALEISTAKSVLERVIIVAVTVVW